MSAPEVNTASNETVPVENSVIAAIKAACATVAPTWPLDRMIAVNPYWERKHQHFDEVARDLAQLAGSPLTMPLAYYKERWQAG
ncbi:MAG: putative inorganic carbon transporter subunit DabA, partial [Ketobacteraceae bacterium]|nr:putative inorganic carbon transporter subunit DabA [Ketobacteraceae bacterium]